MQGNNISILNERNDRILQGTCHIPAAKAGYLHPHGFGNAPYLGANGAHANDGQPLASERITHFVTHGEKGFGIGFTEAKVHFAHAPNDGKHEPNGHFCRCRGGYFRNVGHGNAACLSGSNVNDIVAGTVIGNDLQLLAGADDFPSQGGACYHCICMGEELHQLFIGENAAGRRNVHRVPFQQGKTLCRNAGCDHNVRHGLPPYSVTVSASVKSGSTGGICSQTMSSASSWLSS